MGLFDPYHPPKFGDRPPPTIGDPLPESGRNVPITLPVPTLPPTIPPGTPQRFDGVHYVRQDVPISEKPAYWILVRTSDHQAFSLGSSCSLWTEHPERALRFARKEDAEAFARVYLSPGFMIQAHEID